MFDDRLKHASPLRPSDVVTAPDLSREGRARHAFFTRLGGVSQGIYAGLNMGIGSKDAPEAVEENRSRGMHVLGLAGPDLATPWQIHSPDAVVVEGPFAGDRPRADAIVTRVPGFAIGVVTADCGPILFADEAAGVVGAAHAGWGGATGGVIEATIAAMEGCGATRTGIVAVLGPCITAANYEVGLDRLDAAVKADARAEGFFHPGASADKRQFDLPGYIVARLDHAGVRASFTGHCTYADEERFFSFRRTTHRGEPDYGRQLSAIALER